MQNDPAEDLRKELLRIQAQLTPATALAQITAALQNGTVGEKQSGLGTAANLNEKGVDELITQWLDNLMAGKVQPELQLDVLDAAAKRDSSIIKSKLETYESGISRADTLFERAEAQCLRCHKVSGETRA